MSEFVTTPSPEPSTSPSPQKKESVFSFLFDYLEILVFSACAVLLIFTLFGRLCKVNGSSMRNTLFHEEMLITTSLVTPKAGDIIVFHQTSETNPRLNEPLVKRIIATEGQTVRIDYIALLDQRGVDIGRWTQVPTYGYDRSTGIFEATVPEGCYFVMGDNRNNSLDSRSAEVGFVDARRVLGKVIIRTQPWTVYESNWRYFHAQRTHSMVPRPYGQNQKIDHRKPQERTRDH